MRTIYDIGRDIEYEAKDEPAPYDAAIVAALKEQGKEYFNGEVRDIPKADGAGKK